MKKFKKALSLLLALSMIFALVVFPTTANAALNSPAGTIRISYELSRGGYPVSEANKLFPGDAYTVDVYVTSSEANSPLTTATFDIVYDNHMTYNGTTFETSFASNATADVQNGVIRLLSQEIDDFEFTAQVPVKVATLSFNVKTDAPASEQHYIGSASPLPDTLLMFDGVDFRAGKSNLTEAQVLIPVSEYPARATVGGYVDSEINGKVFYDENGVDVKVEDLGGIDGVIATLTCNDNTFELKDTAALLAGTKADVTGVYTLTVLANGWAAAKQYTFTVNAFSISATLNFDASDITLPYKRGNTITVPVSLTGLADGVAASMVTFNTIYDADKLELEVEGDNITTNLIEGQGTQVVYDGTGSSSEATLGNGVEFATLKFTVKEDAAFGNTSISSADIADYEQKFVVAGAFVTTDTPLGAASTIKTVIIPDNFATETSTRDSFEDANSEYDIAVVPVEGAEARYGKGSINDGVNLAAVFEDANDIIDGKFKVSEESDYYVITKIGTDPAAYELDILKNGEEIFIDLTAPTLTVPAGTEGWMNSYTRELTAFTAADANGLDDSFGIQYSTNGSDWTPITETNPMNIVDFEGNVTVKAMDIAGNEKTETIAVQVDTTDPTVTLTDNGYVSGGKKAIAIAAADNNGNAKSGLKSGAMVFRSEGNLAIESLDNIMQLSEVEEITLVDGAYTHEVGQSGTYYVVVTDNAGNIVFESIAVTVEHVTDTADLRVKTVEGDTDYHTGFVRDDAVGSPWTHNGYYTYVDFNTTEVSGYTSQILIGDEIYTPGAGIKAESDDAAAELVTITVKTWLDANVNDSVTDTYKFYIVGAANMPSIDSDGRYNAYEIDLVRKTLITPSTTNGFTNGHFSGDVTGDLSYTTDDISALVASFRAFEAPGAYYSLPIMNQTAPSSEQ